MKLRARLALIVLVTALPVVAGTAWTRARFERHTIEQGQRDAVIAQMEGGGRERCEAAPETFPEPPWDRGRGRARDERREFFERMQAGEADPRANRPRVPPERRPPAEGDDPQTSRSTPNEAQPRDAAEPELQSRAPERQGGGAESEPRREGEPEGEPRRGGGIEGDPRRGGDPRAFGRGFDPRRGFGAAGGAARPELWAYDANFLSRNPRAPTFPAELKLALERGEEVASERWEAERAGEPVDGMRFAIRMPWQDGPCAIMLLQRHDTGPRSAVKDLLLSSLALCAVLLGAVLLAAGPIVERVRALTAQVRHSASVRYAAPVDEKGRDEITELARAFNSAGGDVRANLEAVETRERTLRTFVENTSHDVMLPLTVLQGHLTAIQRKVASAQVPEQELVRDALEESHYLSSLLQNLSVAAKLEGGEPLMARHRVDLNALVERAVSRQRPIARQKGVQVDFAVPETALSLVGDVTFVEQMVSNVIHNAVRYNKEGGHVAVVLEERGDQFALRVLDDGPGIPQDLRDKVVERSFRTDDARSRAPDGLGLGLSIASDVARRHGLSMTMRESAAGGLEVEFTGPSARLG